MGSSAGKGLPACSPGSAPQTLHCDHGRRAQHCPRGAGCLGMEDSGVTRLIARLLRQAWWPDSVNGVVFIRDCNLAVRGLERRCSYAFMFLYLHAHLRPWPSGTSPHLGLVVMVALVLDAIRTQVHVFQKQGSHDKNLCLVQ